MADMTAALAECRPIVCAKIMSKMSNNILWGAFEGFYTSNGLIGDQTVMVTHPKYNANKYMLLKKRENILFFKRPGTLSSDPEGIDPNLFSCFITVYQFKIHAELIFLVVVFGDSWGLHGTATIAM